MAASRCSMAASVFAWPDRLMNVPSSIRWCGSGRYAGQDAGSPARLELELGVGLGVRWLGVALADRLLLACPAPPASGPPLPQATRAADTRTRTAVSGTQRRGPLITRLPPIGTCMLPRPLSYPLPVRTM